MDPSMIVQNNMMNRFVAYFSTGNPFTAHTTNPVPFVWVSNHTEGKTIKDGKLADIAPTMLNVLGLEVPAEMTGENLIINK